MAAVASFEPSGFRFGARSLREMTGVHPELVAVAWLALQLSSVDFGFYDGLRTQRQQAGYLEAGTSWSSHSYHLTGDAMDLVPWVSGAYSWDWQHVAEVYRAVRLAAAILGVRLLWGGAWDRELDRLGPSAIVEMRAYVARRKAIGRDAKPDGAHFQRTSRRQLPPGWTDVLTELAAAGWIDRAA